MSTHGKILYTLAVIFTIITSFAIVTHNWEIIIYGLICVFLFFAYATDSIMLD